MIDLNTVEKSNSINTTNFSLNFENNNVESISNSVK